MPLPTYDKSDNQHYMSEPPNPLDCTGRFSTNQAHLAHIDNDNDSRARLHYGSADFYANLYQWNNADTGANQMDGYAYESVNRFNTVCFQGHQSMYNVASKAYDMTISNTGHWVRSSHFACFCCTRDLLCVLRCAPAGRSSLSGLW